MSVISRAVLPLICLLLFPRTVLAHDILGILLLLASVPLINALLVIVHSVISRSGKQLLMHGGYLVAWVFLFWAFSSYTDSDFLAWLPLVLSVLHTLYLLFQSARLILKKKDDPSADADAA